MMHALSDIARLVNMPGPTFLQATLGYTLPLLLERMALGQATAQAEMEAMAATVGQSVPAICLAHVSDVFQHAFLQPSAVRDASVSKLAKDTVTRRSSPVPRMACARFTNWQI